LVWVGDDTLQPNPHEASNAVADKVVETLVKRHDADAIIAINDDWAAQLIKAAKRRGLDVPRDVSVIGQGNFKIASFFDPEITTLDPQNTAFAEAAIDMLVELIEKGSAASRQSVTVKPKLIVRQSA
jgi:LacI family transcriptional regulator